MVPLLSIMWYLVFRNRLQNWLLGRACLESLTGKREQSSPHTHSQLQSPLQNNIHWCCVIKFQCPPSHYTHNPFTLFWKKDLLATPLVIQEFRRSRKRNGLGKLLLDRLDRRYFLVLFNQGILLTLWKIHLLLEKKTTINQDTPTEEIPTLLFQLFSLFLLMCEKLWLI